jgi:hypothetical protein
MEIVPNVWFAFIHTYIFYVSANFVHLINDNLYNDNGFYFDFCVQISHIVKIQSDSEEVLERFSIDVANTKIF